VNAAAIISASINADIPAHCGDWFMSRLRAGHCLLPRRDALQYRRVPLTPEAVAGFVFWTRSPGPFIERLEELRRRGFAFVVQFALCGYPPHLDPGGIAAEEAIGQAQQIALRFGARTLVWRYDPVIVSVDLPMDWHVANFARIASALRGTTDEVVLAFASPPSHRRARVRDLAVESAQRRALLAALAPIAKRNGLRLCVCADPQALVPGVTPARCIDAQRLSDVAGRDVRVPTGGLRQGCLCARAIDIGDRPGRARPQFCGGRARVSAPTGDISRPMLYPSRQRFPCPSDQDLPF
jgi:hypothetical protein